MTIAARQFAGFGKTYDVIGSLQFYEKVLAHKYPADLVVSALFKHFEKSLDFPMPAHISNIINPPKPKITTAQYITAKEWQKRNQNWSRFEPEAYTIAEYERENSDARAEWDRNQQALTNQNRSGSIGHDDGYDDDNLLIGGY